MKWISNILAFAFLVSLASASAEAQDKKITRKDLPPAVEKTVAEQSKGATIRGFAQEIEKGQKFYEVELTVNGHKKDVLVDEKGDIAEVEEEVAFGTLSPAVQTGLKEGAGSGTIKSVESITKSGKLVAYEGAVQTGKKRSEVQVGPNGKKLAHPE